MANSINEILDQREKTHGKYADVSKLSQTLKEIIRDTPNWDKINDGQKESLEMICNKLGRLLSGDANFRDHWDDIGGYAALGQRSSATSLNTVEKDLAIMASFPNVTAIAQAAKDAKNVP
jgi:hypothetical protein